MPRTTYLRQIARRAEGNRPLLKPLRSLMRLGESTTFVQEPSALTSKPNTLPSIQAAGLKDGGIIFSDTIEKTAAGEVAHEDTALSANVPLKRHTLAVPKTYILSSYRDTAELKDSASPRISEQIDREVQITPARARTYIRAEKSGASPAEQVASVAAQVEIPTMEVQITPARARTYIRAEKRSVSPAEQVASVAAQVEMPGEAQVLRSKPRSISEQDQAVAGSRGRDTSMKSPGQPAQIRLVPLPMARPAPPIQEPKLSQGSAIHIGSIDVQIMPAPIAPLALPTAPSTANPQSASALSREFTSSFGLRQG